jgi:hypothetical protein
MTDPELVANLVLASLVCAIGAAVSFNRPSWSRSYTSAIRFRAAFLTHIVLYVTVFFVFFLILCSLFEDKESITKIHLGWISLAMTLFVRARSRNPRLWLIKKAGVPAYAESLSNSLAECKVEPRPEVMARSVETLKSCGIVISPGELEPFGDVKSLLLKTTYLFIQIRQWETATHFKPFVTEAKNELDRLRRRFDRLVFRVSKTLESIERLGELSVSISESRSTTSDESRSSDDLLRKIVSNLIADTCENITAFHHDVCLLVARAALTTTLSRRGRQAMISHLGLQFESQKRSVRYGFLIVVGAVLYVCVWFCFKLIPAWETDIRLRNLVIVVSLSIFGSIAIAIVPKLRWGFANDGLFERTPWHFVIGAGICAVILQVIIRTIAADVGNHEERTMHSVLIGLSFSPTTFLTASTVAWLSQDHRWAKTISASKRRLQDAATLGVVWVIASILSIAIRVEVGMRTPHSWDLLKTVAISLIMGAVIGFVTPEFARRKDVRQFKGIVEGTKRKVTTLRSTSVST